MGLARQVKEPSLNFYQTRLDLTISIAGYYTGFWVRGLSQGISLSVLADDLSESERLVECLETKLGHWSKDNKTRALSAISFVGVNDARTEQAELSLESC